MSEKDKYEMTANIEIGVKDGLTKELAIELVKQTEVIILILEKIIDSNAMIRITSAVGKSEKVKKMKEDKEAVDILIKGYEEYILGELQELKNKCN